MIDKLTEREKIKRIVKKLFKDDEGLPFELTDGQAEIVEIISKRLYARNHLMCYTQYGKSVCVALAVLLRLISFPEKWAIIAGTEKKARIIMSYIIQHAFDSPVFYKKLELSKGESMERLRRERSKDRLTFKVDSNRFSEVFVLSAVAKRTFNFEEALMGFGSQNIIEDEAALIPDPIHSTVMRMLGGFKDNFFVKIGNPFRRNHFLKSYDNKLYHKILIDCKQGIKEGRITEDYTEEMKKESFFNILYDCKFPKSDEFDKEGWTHLITESVYQDALTTVKPTSMPFAFLGVDIGRGGNYNAYVIRADRTAWLEHKDRNPDLMANCGKCIMLSGQYKIDASNIFLDDCGVGSGVTDRLREQEVYINAAVEGAKADDNSKFINKRAECFWRAKLYLEAGGKIIENEDKDFEQLLGIKYKVDSTNRIKIMSKAEMRKQGIESPDIADAFSLTFYRESTLSLKRSLENIQVGSSAGSEMVEWADKFTMGQMG